MTIDRIIPDVEALLALEPEELGGIVLRYLTTAEKSELNIHNFTLNHSIASYPPAKHETARRALMEAWIWLEREGFLAPQPDNVATWRYITRRGLRAAEAENFAAYQASNLLPKSQLHPVIAQKVWATFLRGDYDTAVFQSFKELEVHVRNAAGLEATDIGMELMRKAFRPELGPLTDTSLPKGEQESLMHLMAGAIGSYKNPSSHRSVTIEAEEAAEMIGLASHLLRIVDKRSAI
ncbi:MULTISPECIES: TIGR02391 family protein [Xanthomonas]|uniref:TIGR02391 family protein n=1 Tax=Xanthomonas TaxID=338 RepID=UPI0013DFD0BE|nr:MULTISPECIES: TIGR02391 family protein [Xanthomonas]MBV6846167.1 TIGR02391 family protein [Xanthomonas campestris pv. paulliniae]MCC8668708.1 TIGR02391 family protein [Xanthomonas arboricola]WDI93604.1 TIGR02391 family protein [Xanthomonas campestris]